eukprot:5402015-Alexandrium_andersonii.AAC.1
MHPTEYKDGQRKSWVGHARRVAGPFGRRPMFCPKPSVGGRGPRSPNGPRWPPLHCSDVANVGVPSHFAPP